MNESLTHLLYRTYNTRSICCWGASSRRRRCRKFVSRMHKPETGIIWTLVSSSFGTISSSNRTIFCIGWSSKVQYHTKNTATMAKSRKTVIAKTDSLISSGSIVTMKSGAAQQPLKLTLKLFTKQNNAAHSERLCCCNSSSGKHPPSTRWRVLMRCPRVALQKSGLKNTLKTWEIRSVEDLAMTGFLHCCQCTVLVGCRHTHGGITFLQM